MKSSVCFIIYISFLLLRVESNPVDLNQNFLFDSLRNVTRGATSLISNSIQKPKKIFVQAFNTAKDYVMDVVERPRNMLINATGAVLDSTSRKMEIEVKSLMEILRINMKYGIPALDLPILDPFRIEHMDFAVDNKDFGNISSSIDNVTIYQLSTFVVDHVKLSLTDGVSLAINLSLPTIPADGMYRVSGTMGKMFAVNGEGPFNLEVHGAKCYVHTVLGFSNSMYAKSVDLDFSIESLNASFKHLFPDPEVDDTMNKVISKMAPEILEVLKPEIKPQLEEIIAERINATVARLTMRNIFAILTGSIDIRSLSHLITP